MDEIKREISTDSLDEPMTAPIEHIGLEHISSLATTSMDLKDFTVGSIETIPNRRFQTGLDELPDVSNVNLQTNLPGCGVKQSINDNNETVPKPSLDISNGILPSSSIDCKVENSNETLSKTGFSGLPKPSVDDQPATILMSCDLDNSEETSSDASNMGGLNEAPVMTNDFPPNDLMDTDETVTRTPSINIELQHQSTHGSEALEQHVDDDDSFKGSNETVARNSFMDHSNEQQEDSEIITATTSLIDNEVAIDRVTEPNEQMLREGLKKGLNDLPNNCGDFALIHGDLKNSSSGSSETEIVADDIKQTHELELPNCSSLQTNLMDCATERSVQDSNETIPKTPNQCGLLETSDDTPPIPLMNSLGDSSNMFPKDAANNRLDELQKVAKVTSLSTPVQDTNTNSDGTKPLSSERPPNNATIDFTEATSIGGNNCVAGDPLKDSILKKPKNGKRPKEQSKETSGMFFSDSSDDDEAMPHKKSSRANIEQQSGLAPQDPCDVLFSDNSMDDEEDNKMRIKSEAGGQKRPQKEEFARGMVDGAFEEPTSLSCKICSKGFQSATKLIRHITSAHDFDKQLKCQICDRHLSTNDLLKEHIQATHDVSKRLNCEFCGKVFFRPDSMKNHILLLHEKDDVFRCKMCPESFTKYGHLNDHLEAVHAKQNLRWCKDCKLTFDDVDALEKHSKAFHNVKQGPIL